MEVDEQDPPANAHPVIAPVPFVCARNECSRTRVKFTFANSDAQRWAKPEQPLVANGGSMLNVAEMSNRLTTALGRIGTYRDNAIAWLDEWEASISAYILIEPVQKTLDGYILVWSTEARELLADAKKTVMAWYESMMTDVYKLDRLMMRYDTSYSRLRPYTHNVYDAAPYDPIAQAIKYTKNVRNVVRSTNRMVSSDHNIRTRWLALSRRIELASQGQLVDQTGNMLLNFVQLHNSLVTLLPNTGLLMTAQNIVADRITSNAMTAEFNTGPVNDLADIKTPVDQLPVLTTHVTNIVASLLAFSLYTPNKYTIVSQIRRSLEALSPAVRDPLTDLLNEFVEQHTPEVYLAAMAEKVESENRIEVQAAKQSMLGKLNEMDEEAIVYQPRMQQLLDRAIDRLANLAEV